MPVIADGSGVSVDIVQMLTANTSRVGAGTLYDLCAAPAGGKGKKVLSVLFKSAAASIAATDILRIWLYDGVTNYLIDEIPVPLDTPSTTSPAWQKAWTPPIGNGFVGSTGLLEIPAGWTLRASTNNGGTYNALTRSQTI